MEMDVLTEDGRTRKPNNSGKDWIDEGGGS